MRDSLRKLPAPGERLSAKKVGRRGLAMPAAAAKRERGRRSARGASPSGQEQQRKKSLERRVERSSSRKRTRGALTHQQMGASSSRGFLDPSPSPTPTNRKRARPTNADEHAASSTRPGREKKATIGGGASARSSSSACKGRMQRGASSARGLVPPRPASSKINEGRSSSRQASSVSRAAKSEAPVAAAAPAVDAPPSWPFQQQQPQRQTRKRPVDPDKLMKVFIGEDTGAGGDVSSSSNSSRGKNTAREPVQTLDSYSFNHGGKNGCDDAATAMGSVRAPSSRSGTGSNGTALPLSRRHGARCGGARVRGAAASPGNARSCTAAAGATTGQPEQAPRAIPAGASSATPASSTKDNVICPQFRLHNLFDSTPAGCEDDKGRGSASGMKSAPSGSRRRRPVRAAGASGAGTMAPPRRSASARCASGGREVGFSFLEQTEGALVRSTQAVLGSDYDMDDEDSAFLEQLNNGGSGGAGEGESGEKWWAISADLFEAMIERLERQESRARDTMVLVEASLRLKEEHDDAAARVDQFIKEGDAVLNFDVKEGMPRDDDSSAGRTTMANDPGSDGSNTNGHSSDGCSGGGGGSSSGGRRRKKQVGYAQEDDSDSDDGEHQARIMRTRGPVTLTEAFALPLLRSCVVSAAAAAAVPSQQAGGETGARGTSSAKGWKGKGKGKAKQPASRRGKSSGGDEEEEEEASEVSDEQLLAVFEYWAEKRKSFGGPMLRCFHPFIMKLWRRMEDPVREAEDQEEGRDPHASPEAFDTLKSFRQDLDKARLVVDCVKRREKLKRSVIRFANAYWKILDDTMDAPRPGAPAPSRFSHPKAAAPPQTLPPSARPSTRMAARATNGSANNGGGEGAAASEGGRSSGRAAAAAARAAVSALATAEALEMEDQYDEVTAGPPNRRKGVEGQDAQPPPSAKSKSQPAGFAEQEQAWNTFAQLPTRQEAVPLPGAENAVLTSRQRKKGKGAAAAAARRGTKETLVATATAAPLRGLFVHRGVRQGGGEMDAVGDSSDNRQQALSSGQLPWSSGAGARGSIAEGVPQASRHRRSINSRKAPTAQVSRGRKKAVAAAAMAQAEAGEVAGDAEDDDRAKRRARFNSASQAALARQQSSRRQSSGPKGRSGLRLREPKSEEVEAGEEQVQEVVGPAANGRSSRRGGGGGGRGRGRRGAGREPGRSESQEEEAQEAKPIRSTTRRRKLAEPEDAEEEVSGSHSNRNSNADNRRKTVARGSKKTPGSSRPPSPPTPEPETSGRGTKRRRLEENNNLENGALGDGSGRHQQQDKTRGSRSVAAVVVVEDVPTSPKAVVVPLPGRKESRPAAGGRKSSRFASDGRGNRALVCLS